MLILILWDIVGNYLVNIASFLLFLYIFNVLFTYKTYNLKFILMGLITIVTSSLAIIKIANIKIDTRLIYLIIVLSGIVSAVFITEIKKHYCE